MYCKLSNAGENLNLKIKYARLAFFLLFSFNHSNVSLSTFFFFRLHLRFLDVETRDDLNSLRAK